MSVLLETRSGEIRLAATAIWKKISTVRTCAAYGAASATAGQPATWRPPYAKLGALSKLFFVLRNQLEKTSQPAGIQKAH